MPQLGEVRIGREIGYKTGWTLLEAENILLKQEAMI